MRKKSVLFSIYVSVVLALMVLPINNDESNLNNTYLINLRLDYLSHSLLFIPWMLLKTIKRTNSNVLIWFLTGMLFATVAESIQYLLPYRSFNINDLLANSLGVAISILTYYFIIRIKRNETAFIR